MERILIVGATSAIAEATARRFAQQGAKLYLLARNRERMEGLARDLRIRGASQVSFAVFDANDFDSHQALLQRAIDDMGGLDLVLIAHGTLGDQKACEKSFPLTLRELNTNAISVISLLTHLANDLEAQRHGTIAVISSVAGDRGRQSNYVYGTAKGAVSIFLQGLRNRLHKKGVHVLTIKPGFVDTPMTAAFRKGPLWASADRIAEGIVRSVQRKRDEVYLPGWWAAIMMVIRNIPERIFRTLSL
ncbi:SDR family oxidoreductase [Noviherbaspirillum massiliense]|uniref:SDR family oxidoreductase n=1 Tax=Noviherbaspirillum massiliense TaxID=1465823 RepID=UPI000474D22A|nr:SDR family oxidoreductase [Noviherbaspirillum massiliense]